MTGEERQVKKDNFTDWTTFIEDRVDFWFKDNSRELLDSLDYSAQSLNVIESYILSNFSKDYILDMNNKTEVDVVISYYGETLRRCLPNSTWYIELEDEDSFNFNLPSIKTSIGTPISPYSLIKRVINKNQGTFLYDFYITRLGFINNPETY